MADYKELLRRAIEALPENNGAARRAVYEKARSALVGQLRAIDPPLPAREITQHRLQLEDCIRQVEQEASEAVIAGLKQHAEAPAPQPSTPEPIAESEPVAEPEPAETEARAIPEAADEQEAPVEPVVAEAVPDAVGEEPLVEAEPAETEASQPEAAEPESPESEPEPRAEAEPEPEPEPENLPEAQSIEDIIAADEATSSEPEIEAEPAEETTEATQPETPPEPGTPDEPENVEDDEAPAPAANDTAPTVGGVTSIVARAEANKSAPSSPLPFRNPLNRPFGNPVKGPSFESRRDTNVVAAQRIEPALSGQAVARQQVAEPLAVVDQQASVALSSVREVELEPAADPQTAIDRAIETLDREARGESTDGGEDDRTVVEVNDFAQPDPVKEAEAATTAHESFEDEDARERGGGSALTIFLLVFVLLLAGAGGAGYWAWREGYVDPAAMFGQGAVTTPDVPATVTPPAAPTATMSAETATPANNTAPSDAAEAQTPPDQTTGPGNTTTSSNVAEPTQELKSDDRLLPENDVIAAETEPTPPTDENKSEERLPTGDAATAAPSETALDAATLAGSQSLLLEASDDGTTGAVPFTGTVEWSEGKDETGLPTLIGKANIPARNLGVDVLIRKNSDPSLPASHLMEINFNVSDTFMGGSIAGLPGVLLKNEELVQGTPLIGASARVVGNSFLFALSASPDDATTNNNLLTTRKWMDLALIYATGKRAIITLEKDDEASALFTKVFAEWAKTSPATPASADGDSAG